MRSVGNRYRKKILKAKPMRAIGKFTAMGLGAATLGTVGLAAGIASGDAGKALSYTAAGAGVGGALGGTMAENAMDEGAAMKESFKKGYLGDKEYTNRKLDEEYYNGDGFQEMLNNEDLRSDLKGRARAKAIREEVQEYRRSGITDNNQIATCMREGLTPEQGVYAIQIAKAMEKSGWENQQIRNDYKARSEQLMRDKNLTDEQIRKVWNTSEKLIF